MRPKLLYNKIVEDFVFPLGDAYLHTAFIKELKYWRSNINNFSADQLHNLQKERLKTLLNHTITNIPWYRNQKLSLTGDPYVDIKKFPVMHKKAIRENIDQLYLGDKKKMVVEKSSGSSGIQGEVYMTLKENVGYQAVQTYIWEWGGYRLGDKILQTGITPERKGLKRLKDVVLRTQYVNAFNLPYDKIISELKKAKNNNCEYFAGYASSLNVFAEAALKAKLNVEFKGVISWGDKLFDHYKTNISNAFGNPTFAEVYGTTEGFMISGLCEHGNHHILTPHVYIELLDKNGNEVPVGELGYVVVTRLDCFSMPLIRYYLGDLAIKEEPTKQCSCGRAFPMLKKIVGRDTDVVHTPNGKALIVHFFTGVFEHVPAIQQFRVIQKDRSGIDIEYIPAPSFKPTDLDTISAMIYNRAEETFPVKYIKVDRIPPTKSGKPQLVLNTIATKLTDNL